MARSMLTWVRLAAVAALATQTIAQQCYYPNGKLADKAEKACSSAEGSACCPDTWECLDNGLCYNPAAKIYGRYSCTDKDWNSPGCASNMCTYGMTAAGAEGIQQCSNHNNDWCCDANRQDVHCCEGFPQPRPFFQLQDGKAYATIGQNQASDAPTLSTITGLATGSGGGSSPSLTPAPSSGGGASPSPSPSATADGEPSPSPFVSVSLSVSRGPSGDVTVERTITITPTADPTAVAAGDASSSGGSKSNLGLIVGCAVGIPLALALIGIVFWLLRKRRNQKANAYKESPEMDHDSAKSAAFAGGAGAKLGKDTYRHSRPGTTEIDGAPIGPGVPVSNLPGHAELDSGAGFQPGHGPAYTPDTVGLGGGNGDGRSTWESAPPGYSPGMNQAGFAPQPVAMELADTSVVPVINEKEASQPQPQPQPQQYQAYRPPQPVAEMPTVLTPPEDVEKQVRR